MHPGDVQVFALDIGAVGWDQGSKAWETSYAGSDPSLKQSFRVYGKPMHALADGTVCWALNDQPERPTNTDTSNPISPSQGIYFGGGNQIFIKSGGEISVLAHLQPGSIPPELLVPGAAVKQGQYIGKAGLSGSTSVPAPHFHVKNVPVNGAPPRGSVHEQLRRRLRPADGLRQPSGGDPG